MVPFPKVKIVQMMEFLRNGQLKADKYDDLKEIADMLAVFEVPVEKN